MERVRREIDRMDLLVADLLLSAEVREAPQHLEHPRRAQCPGRRRALEEFVQRPPRTRGARRDRPAVLAVRGREDLLDRLLVNSFSNIIRHTPKDTAGTRDPAPRRSRARTLCIEDGGRGLPEYGVRPQRFRRFDQSRSRETGGSGLGMSIMADIAEGTRRVDVDLEEHARAASR